MKLTNQQIYELVKIITTAIVAVAATLLTISSCISTKNHVTNSENVRIDSQQSLQQKNDSINIKTDVQ